MGDLDRALADISEIRGQLARGVEFRGYGVATLALTGGLAAVAGVVQARWMPDPANDVPRYLGLWTAAATVSLTAIAWETIARTRRVHLGLAQEMLLSAVEQFLPAAAGGVLLTAVLLRTAPEALWMLPGLWQIILALGVCASSRFLPRPMILIGAWYLATGLACLVLARGGHAFSPWAMAAPFCIGQFMVAAVLQLSLRGGHGQR